MKKNILIGLAALLLCGTVNATSWRVCSKPEAGANFTSIADAVASNNVFAGDTLYVEPGHVEMGSTLHITKRLTIIGPGYCLIDNNINTMNPSEAVINKSLDIEQSNTTVYGLHIQGGMDITSDNITIERCLITHGLTITNGYGNIVRQCFVNTEGIRNNGSATSSIIENNIVYGDIYSYSSGSNSGWQNSTIRNNVVVGSGTNYVIRAVHECNIYNNIVINTNTSYTTTTNPDQTVDTTWRKHFAIDAPASDGNTVRNNITSGKPNAEFLNCVFNATVEDVLIWNEANTLEEKYKHKANGPAVGAGVNGTTCGAYGAVTGSQAYQPAGIPQYRPYIYDATIDETPSSNNTINASFKIKVQQ